MKNFNNIIKRIYKDEIKYQAEPEMFLKCINTLGYNKANDIANDIVNNLEGYDTEIEVFEEIINALTIEENKMNNLNINKYYNYKDNLIMDILDGDNIITIKELYNNKYESFLIIYKNGKIIAKTMIDDYLLRDYKDYEDMISLEFNNSSNRIKLYKFFIEEVKRFN